MVNKYMVSVIYLSIALTTPVLGSTAYDQIAFVQGTVSFRLSADDKSVGASATSGERITKSTQIMTGENGLAEIRFKDGAQVRLTGNTSIRMEELHYSPNLVPLDRITRFELLKGTIYVDYRPSNDHIIVHAKGIQWLTSERPVSCRISREGGQTLVSVFEGSLFINSLHLGDIWTTDWIWDQGWDGKDRNFLRVRANESVRSDADAGVITFVAHGVDKLKTDSWNDTRHHSSPMAAPATISKTASAQLLSSSAVSVPAVDESTSKARDVSTLNWSPMCEMSDYGHLIGYDYGTRPLSGLQASFKLDCVALEWPVRPPTLWPNGTCCRPRFH
jgi:hypothetical protein